MAVGLLPVCMEVEVACVPVCSVSPSTWHLALAGPGPLSLLSARRHMSLARAVAASTEGDTKELLAEFPAGREARRVLGTPQRREAGWRGGREASCLSSE